MQLSMVKTLPFLTLKRIVDKKLIANATGILGKVYDGDELVCFSIERPDLDNKQFISCIPTGTYKCSRDKTGDHQYYKIEDVPKRDGIEIHVANKPDELEGCIAFGSEGVIMNGNIAIRNSKPTLDKLLEKYPGGFHLIIIDCTNII